MAGSALSKLLLTAASSSSLCVCCRRGRAVVLSARSLRGDGGWVHDGGATFPPVPGSPSPVVQDPKHPFISQAASWRIGDLSNPNLRIG